MVLCLLQACVEPVSLGGFSESNPQVTQHTVHSCLLGPCCVPYPGCNVPSVDAGFPVATTKFLTKAV